MDSDSRSATAPERATMVFVMHNHQPAGNFDHVFRESFDRSYRPTLELLAQFESIHASLHYTGPLLEWIASHDPSFLDLLKKLADRGQVEILGGGYYEPIFCWLREADQKRQVALMRARLDALPSRPNGGFWLAERVWETGLPARLAPLGLSYAALDDHHFHLAGLPNEALHGYYTVSWEGHPLKIFPISKELRYLIPFRPPDQLLAFLDRNARGGKVLTYADDGEKFGAWPETYRWVWEERYLESLFSMLSRQSDWLRVASMGEIVEDMPPTGVAVLPNASYVEMMEWALPATLGNVYHRWAAKREREGGDPALVALFRGGFFENFLVKYPDVNRLYHRMLMTGTFIRDGYGTADPPEPVLLPYLKAQGNDVYWHGLFGGIYLSNLRHEAFKNLLQAERAMEQEGTLPVPALLTGDFDGDGVPEWFQRGRRTNLWITPRYGGSLLEWDDRATCFHLTNTVTRHEEAYHERYRDQLSAGGDPGATSPGPGEAGIPPTQEFAGPHAGNLLAGAVFDARPRRAFSDMITRSGTPLGALFDASGADLDLSRTSYRVREGTLSHLFLEVSGRLSDLPFLLEKRYYFTEEGFTVTYRISPEGEAAFPSAWSGLSLVVELPLTLLAGHDSGRILSVEPGTGETVNSVWDQEGTYPAAEGWSGSDTWSGTSFRVGLPGGASLFHRPIETVSLSEAGLEKTFQGTLFLHSFPLDRVCRGEASIVIRHGSS